MAKKSEEALIQTITLDTVWCPVCGNTRRHRGALIDLPVSRLEMGLGIYQRQCDRCGLKVAIREEGRT